MEKIFDLISFVKDLLEKRKKDKKLFFDNCIEPTYCKGKQAYLDLIGILRETRNMLQNECVDIKLIEDYLKTSRFSFQVEREELCSRTIVIKNEVDSNTDIYMFAVAIRGILFGGMTGRNYQNNMEMITRYTNGISTGEELLFYEGEHTLLNLIRQFNQQTLEVHDDILYRKKLLSAINLQLESLENYFKLLSFSYEKIRWTIFKCG